MGKQVLLFVVQSLVNFAYSIFLKFTAMMTLLPIFLILTTFFDARLPDGLVWLFIKLSGGHPTFSIDEFVRVIFLIVFVFWIIEQIILYILTRYFHKKISRSYNYQLRTWFVAVSVVYLVGLFSILFANLAEGTNIGAMSLVVIMFYIIAVIPIGLCKLIDGKLLIKR